MQHESKIELPQTAAELQTKPLCINVKEIRRLTAFSKSSIYRLIKSKRLVPINNLFKRNKVFLYEDVLALLKK